MTTDAGSTPASVNGRGSNEHSANEHRPLRPLEWFLLVLPGTIWGSSFYFIAIALDDVSPGLITPLRIAIGFFTLALFPKSRQSLPATEWRKVVVLALVWLAIPLTAFPYAELHVSSSVIGMLNGASPVFVALVAIGMLRRLPPPMQRTGLIVGTAGVVLIALPSLGRGSSSVFGVMLVLGALVLYGFALNVAAPLQRRFGALPVLWRAQGVALLCVLPLGIASLDESRFSWKAAGAVLVLGAFGTALAHYMMATLAGRIGSTRASASLYLMPPVSLFLGVVLRGERLDVVSVIGSAVTVGGAWLLGRTPAATASTPSASAPNASASARR